MPLEYKRVLGQIEIVPMGVDMEASDG